MRKNTRVVNVGTVNIGGNSNIAIQSMTNTKTENTDQTLNQIRQLLTAGADLVRLAIPNKAAVESFKAIRKSITKPLIADIHFDHQLAILALEAGADKVRINPGNIGSWDKVFEIIDIAKHCNSAIRIGVNGGSLDKVIKEKYGGPTAEALAESAKQYEDKFLERGFTNFVVSIKSSDVLTTIAANRIFSSISDTPLHLGVTEAGTPKLGIMKSSIGIGSLLCDGIGDTFRVSLTADPVQEILVAQNILKVLGLRKQGIEIISCPTCGRTNSDLIRIVNEIEDKVSHITKPLKIAIMGCVVNGPGEAEEADLGLALGLGKGALFSKGKIKRVITEANYIEILLDEINKLAE